MRKFSFSILFLFLILSISTTCFAYQEASGILLNGNEIYLDVKPIIIVPTLEYLSTELFVQMYIPWYFINLDINF